MTGGKTLLKWKEPREVWQHYKQHLSLPRRLWLQHRGPFLAGFVVGSVMVLGAGLPDSPEELRRTLIAAPIACFGMGLFFTFIYGLLALTSPRVYLKEKCVMRSHGEDVERWDYADLERYEVEAVPVGERAVRVLTLRKRDGDAVRFEIAPSVSEREIHRALEGKLLPPPAAA